MTTTEAAAHLSSIDPDRSWCVNEEVWYFKHDPSNIKTAYVIYAVPGYNGGECQRFTEPTIEAALAAVAAERNNSNQKET